MSQAKVDKHKQEKYNRKKNVKKRNFKKIAAYVVATLIAIAFIGYIGYSVAIDTVQCGESSDCCDLLSI